uniref:Uncharacterized protein n=1 Tax=Physcomitrium patens TaxID=3218 RepID=A0A2K1KCE8_PHYPA|nr:hypothetical protein PHYPA_010647 [Physcomitrium patens]
MDSTHVVASVRTLTWPQTERNHHHQLTLLIDKAGAIRFVGLLQLSSRVVPGSSNCNFFSFYILSIGLRHGYGWCGNPCGHSQRRQGAFWDGIANYWV